MPPVYRADHTAHIRRRLRSMAVMCLTGAALAGVAAGVLALLGSLSGDRHRGLLRAAWAADIVTFAVALIGLLITFVIYLIYRRRRAELDAAGAEVYGELRARIHHG
ncbi:hypothetical protein WEI85_00400 [Actinomycetes bacterium KLBMP 9797]